MAALCCCRLCFFPTVIIYSNFIKLSTQMFMYTLRKPLDWQANVWSTNNSRRQRKVLHANGFFPLDSKMCSMVFWRPQQWLRCRHQTHASHLALQATPGRSFWYATFPLQPRTMKLVELPHGFQACYKALSGNLLTPSLLTFVKLCPSKN